MNLRNAIKQSCDIYFYEVARRLGIDRLAVTSKKFGLGKKVLHTFLEERSGVVPPALPVFPSRSGEGPASDRAPAHRPAGRPPSVPAALQGAPVPGARAHCSHRCASSYKLVPIRALVRHSCRGCNGIADPPPMASSASRSQRQRYPSTVLPPAPRRRQARG